MAEPPITTRAYHDSGTPNTPVKRIVIHATAGGTGFPHESQPPRAHNTAEYFASPSSGGSAHYVCDTSEEEHCVPDGVIAWHAPPNQFSLGIEICGEASYTRKQWLDGQVWPAVARGGARVQELADRHGVPKVKLSVEDLLADRHGICGHVDVSNAWNQTSHWDPGPGFPWDRFMVEVNGGTPPPPPAHPTVLTWNLPAGHYYGNILGPVNCHGGYYASERPFVQNIQRWLIFHGCTPIPASAWSWSTWADGLWQTATDTAMVTWHNRFYPVQPYPKQCWSDDYRRLAVA